MKISLSIALLVVAFSLGGCADGSLTSPSSPAPAPVVLTQSTKQADGAAKETVAPESAVEVAAANETAAQEAAAQESRAKEPPAQEVAAGPAPAKPTNDDAPVTRPKADRTPRKPGEPIRINFDHIILGMQKDMVFRPWMINDDVKELDGQRVSITGVMNGVGIASQKRLKEFVLLRNKECKFGPGGQADHLAMVTMKEGQTIDYGLETVRVEGTLRIKPETGSDGNTWSIYELEDATAQVQQ